MAYNNDWNVEFDEHNIELRPRRPSSCTVQSIVRNVWNHIADEHNQWEALGQDEKNALMDAAVANAKHEDLA